MKKKVSNQDIQAHPQDAVKADNALRLPDIERFALQYEKEAVLEEYRSLFDNMNGRITNQQQIINFAITFIAALIALSQILPNLSSQTFLGSLYLVISLVFSSFALMYLEHDSQVRAIGIYIEIYLRPQIQRILSDAHSTNPVIWQWEEYHRSSQFRSIKNTPFFFVMSASRFALTVVPCIALIIVYWKSRLPGTQIPVWENLLFIAALLGAIWVLATIVFVSTLYTKDPKSKVAYK